MKKKSPELLADCAAGAIVRIDAGLVRVGSMVGVGERWCRLLRDDLSETSVVFWAANRTRVLEVLRDQSHYANAKPGVEVDPLQGGLP